MVTPLAHLKSLEYSLSRVMTESPELYHLQGGQEQGRPQLTPRAMHIPPLSPLLMYPECQDGRRPQPVPKLLSVLLTLFLTTPFVLCPTSLNPDPWIIMGSAETLTCRSICRALLLWNAAGLLSMSLLEKRESLSNVDLNSVKGCNWIFF